MRRFDLANRNRHKIDAALEWSPHRVLTLSPNFGLRYDDYPDPELNPLGVRKDHSWNAGIEVSAAVHSTLRLMASYNYEDRRLNMASGSGGANLNTGNPLGGCSTSAAINPKRSSAPTARGAATSTSVITRSWRPPTGRSFPSRRRYPVRISAGAGKRGKRDDPVLGAAVRRRHRGRDQLRRPEHDRFAGDAGRPRQREFRPVPAGAEQVRAVQRDRPLLRGSCRRASDGLGRRRHGESALHLRTQSQHQLGDRQPDALRADPGHDRIVGRQPVDLPGRHQSQLHRAAARAAVAVKW